MYNAAGTVQTPHDVIGQATLTLVNGSGSAPIALSGLAAFTSAASYGLASQPTIVGGTSPLAPISAITTGLSSPQCVAVDSTGNIYVANAGNSTVTKYASTGGAAILTISSGISNPYGVAVDSTGNIYVANAGGNNVLKYASTGGAAILTISSGISSPRGIAVDSSGNIYVANSSYVSVLTSSGSVVSSIGLMNAPALATDVLPFFSLAPISGSSAALLCAVEGAAANVDGTIVVTYKLNGY